MIHEFRLSPPGKGVGLSCDAGGAFVGAVPLLTRLRKNGKDEWRPRECGELSKQIGEQFGVPIDISPKRGGLRVIANALNDGDLVRAQIATVLLAISDPPRADECVRSPERLIKFIQALHWSGVIKWDPDEHPRWPAGSPDSKGGQFAPKGDGDADSAPSSRIQLADADVSDASDDPVAEAVARSGRRAFEHSDSPDLVVAAAEEDDRDPRFGIGGNHPPLDELIPERLLQSPAGPAVQLLDNLLDISGPGDEANLTGAQLNVRALLHQIHEVDPNYVFETIWPPLGLAGMSWQERLNVINSLKADLAAAIYKTRGDIRPLQEVTFDFLQRTTNDAYDEALQPYEKGELNVRLSREEAIGNYMDILVRTRLRAFFNNLEVPTGLGSAIRVNRRAYDPSSPDTAYRIPDARVGNLAFDISLTAKSSSTPQIRGFFSSDFKPVGVVIIRPNQLGNKSSYVIWRQEGD